MWVRGGGTNGATEGGKKGRFFAHRDAGMRGAARRRLGAGAGAPLRWAVSWAVAAVGLSRPLRVLPLGDSVTYGCGDQCDPKANCTSPAPYLHDVISHLGMEARKGSHYHPGQSSGYGEVPCSRCSGGYRGELLKLLTAAGQDVELIGNLENDDGNGRHEGHIGWRIDQITDVIAHPGGIGLGHDGAGGHDTGRRAVPQLGTGVRDYSSMDGGAGWARLQPDVILLHIGTNDIGQGADLDTVVERTRELHTRIFAELPQVQLFHASLISMLPYGPARPLTNDAVMRDFNRMLPGLVNEHAQYGFGAHYVPMHEETGLCDRDWALPLGSTGIMPECCPGKNHPTDDGYRRIADTFFNAMHDKLGFTLPGEEGEGEEGR